MLEEQLSDRALSSGMKTATSVNNKKPSSAPNSVGMRVIETLQS